MLYKNRIQYVLSIQFTLALVFHISIKVTINLPTDQGQCPGCHPQFLNFYHLPGHVGHCWLSPKSLSNSSPLRFTSMLVHLQEVSNLNTGNSLQTVSESSFISVKSVLQILPECSLQNGNLLMALSYLRHYRGSLSFVRIISKQVHLLNAFDVLAHTYHFSLISSKPICFSLFSIVCMNHLLAYYFKRKEEIYLCY